MIPNKQEMYDFLEDMRPVLGMRAAAKKAIDNLYESMGSCKDCKHRVLYEYPNRPDLTVKECDLISREDPEADATYHVEDTHFCAKFERK